MISPVAEISQTLSVAFDLIDNLFTSDDERLAAKHKILTEKNQHSLKVINIKMSAIVEEAKSKDKWTSRARPAFLYVMYFVIMSCFFGGILGIWWPTQVFQAADNIERLLAAIPEALWYLFGSGYLGYCGVRTYDKNKDKLKTAVKGMF